MAKTIKFNLICDGRPVRTIEDLQNNFSIEDILNYYNNRLLHRWLSVRGYNSELKAVSSITSNEEMDIIKELIRIFNVVTDEKEIEEGVYIFQYRNERKKLLDNYNEKDKFIKEKIIDDYKKGYQGLIDKISDNPNNAAVIKASINEIMSNYAYLFHLSYRVLFYILQEKSILAIMCLLMNEKCRKYYLPAAGDKKRFAKTVEDKKAMFNSICQIIQRDDFSTVLGENLKTFAGDTKAYWQDLESNEKKYMIISMGEGDMVRSYANHGQQLERSDVLNKFVILDGIDYKSNNATHTLLYMEV